MGLQKRYANVKDLMESKKRILTELFYCNAGKNLNNFNLKDMEGR